MSPCPVQARRAEDVQSTRLSFLTVSIFDNKSDAYAEADEKQSEGWTIVSIAEVIDLAIWANTTAGVGNRVRKAQGLVWAVVLQR